VSEVITDTAGDVPTSTTNFTDDASGQIAKMSMRTEINPSLKSAAHTQPEESIHDFLAKPYPFLSGVLSSSDTSSTFTRTIYFIQVLNLEPYASKLKGFMGIRADMTVHLVVNANKFQQGRYLLGFVPYGGSGYQNTRKIINGTRYANLTTITQLPHVEIDLSTETSAVLEIPYNAIYSHIPINPNSSNITHCLGEIFLIPYSPLVSTAGSTTASFDMFCSFQNIDLAAPVYPQSSRFIPITEIEQASKKVGPVQAISRSVAVLSNLIGDKIPSLSALTAPVSWAMNIVSGVASVFGWSNPINLEHAMRVNQTAYPYATNVDNVDNCVPLSLYSSNSVEILPGFAGNDIDEMALDYIKAKPAWIQTVSWTTGTTADTSLFQTEVSPALMRSSFASGASTVYCHTPVAFLSNFFNLYRGGLRFTFKLVKTEFHSGRLMLVFNPNAFYGSSVAPNNAQSTYCHREIIDIREGLSFDFVVPYVALAPYKNVRGNFSSIGSLDLRVLNPLIAPATVSSTITILVEVSAAPDMEFAVPNTHSMQQTIVYNPQSSSFVPKPDVNSITTGIIGGAELIHDQHFSARACIGEKIVSLLSFLKKNDIFPTTFPASSFITIDPFSIPIYKTSSSAIVPSDIINDNLSLISSMYLYSRGGVRWRTFIYQNLPITTYTAKLLPTNSSSTAYTGVIVSSSSSTAKHGLVSFNSNADGSLHEVQIPQYHRFHSRINTDEMYNAGVAISVDYSVPTTTCTQVEFGSSDSYTHDFARQASDDFHCGFFLGVPPIVYL
jgi:hypothetical protein